VIKENASPNNGHEPAPPGSEYMTKPEVAQLLRLTTRSIDAWTAHGPLPYYKIGRPSASGSATSKIISTTTAESRGE
jgi:hypothetical protein